MKSSQVMLGLCACLLSLAAIAFAQDKPPTAAPAPDAKAAVTGTVSDETGTGVGGAIVTMDNGAGPATSATTDGQGLYAITDLAPGSYTISVVLRGARIFQANAVLSPGQILTMSVAGAPVAQP
ncbi:MAG: carboxypeptidase-like regulatory domain-containing protein, partial [Candidatus Sulfotelmatobacter sp.]